jgi:cell division protein FtsX
MFKAFPNENWNKVLTMYTVTVTYGIPLTIIITCYYKIIKKIMNESPDSKNISINFKNIDPNNNQKEFCNRKKEPFMSSKIENQFQTKIMMNQSYDDKDDQVNLNFSQINSILAYL